MTNNTNVKVKTRGKGKGVFFPGSKTETLYKGIKSGYRLTASQWAKKLKLRGRSEVYELTGRLRKMGYLISSIGEVHDFQHKNFAEGKIVDLSENQEWFNEVFNRTSTRYTNPHTKNIFKALEIQATKNPAAAKEIRAMAFSLYRTLLEIGEATTGGM